MERSRPDRSKAPKILLVHPPIYDYTAFDFFLYPMGLVHLADQLFEKGYSPVLVDALDRFCELPPVAGLKRPTFRDDGCGHLYRSRCAPPPLLADIPRRYHRFGLPRPILEERMAWEGRPAAVGVTCAMTYWYPGVKETVKIARDLWPGVPVLVGGTYAMLCPDHAREQTGADWVQDSHDQSPLFAFLEAHAGKPEPAFMETSRESSGTFPEDMDRGHALMGRRPSAAVQASQGCPKRCPYCASFMLGGPYRRRPAEEVANEIAFLVLKMGRERIAFYDDMLIDADADPFLDLCARLRSMGLHERATFHCPNALQASSITAEVARALKEASFHTLRIGFETADPALQQELGSKATNPDLAEAMDHLKAAGFSAKETGVYLLVGLPDQHREQVEMSIRFVHESGGLSRLAEYAPIPGTPMFERAKELSRLDLDDPVNHNKTLAPFRFPTLNLDDVRKIKSLSHELNEDLLK
ncbi:MAG: B12-binding domain-containing radical SAM protein [Planctomycetota bacterium]|jgi:hypothetical protein